MPNLAAPFHRWLYTSLLLWTCAATVAALTAQAAERRVALVMGNASGADKPLHNAVNDAELMQRTLNELGFDVSLLRNADVALFFYAGIMCGIATNLDGQIAAGRVKPLAMMSAGFSKDWSRNLPSMSQQGLGAVELSNWHGMFALRGMPTGVLTKINNALHSALQDPEFRRKQESIGAVVVTDNRQTIDGHRRRLQATSNKSTSGHR